MKWGVRRYQNKDGSLTKAGRERYSKKYDASATKTNGKLMAVGIAYMQTIEHRKQYAAEERMRMTSLEQVKRIKGVHSNDSDMAAVNPDYDPSDYKTNYNCALCSIAYEMRRRGYDVKADVALRGTARGGVSFMDQLACFTNTEKPDKSVEYRESYLSSNDKKNDIDTVKSELLELGDDARGIMSLVWDGGGAHSVIWSNEGGVTVIRDCQRNVKTNPEEMLKKARACAICRTDNLDINEKALKYVKNSEE